jgi:hypothetical protein
VVSAGLIAAILALLVACVAIVVAWHERSRKRCPSCGVELVAVGDGTSDDGVRLTYDVLACPHCRNVLTMVEGKRSRYATCPECKERTLETACIRLPDAAGAQPVGDGPDSQPQRRVEVHEHCHLCDHGAVREISDAPHGPSKRGQVIPFPMERRKPPRKKSANNE